VLAVFASIESFGMMSEPSLLRNYKSTDMPGTLCIRVTQYGANFFA